MTVDIVFPVIHGQFGEDGGIQVIDNHSFEEVDFRKASSVFHIMD